MTDQTVRPEQQSEALAVAADLIAFVKKRASNTLMALTALEIAQKVIAADSAKQPR